MKYGILFLGVGLQMAIAAWMYRGWAWMLVWPAVSFILVGSSYLWLGPRLFGKQTSGKIALWSLILLGPYLLYYALVWHIVRLVSREDAFNQLASDVWIGRRLLPGELPAGVQVVVDLTCELPEPREVRNVTQYRCFPILDAAVSDVGGLVALVDEISDLGGPFYIHCAQGHGRTGMFAAMWLIRNGLADSPESAMRKVRGCRPAVDLNRSQLWALQGVNRRIGD